MVRAPFASAGWLVGSAMRSPDIRTSAGRFPNLFKYSWPVRAGILFSPGVAQNPIARDARK
jgi:hypothetical protein